MSCEKNQSQCSTSAASSGGIPSQTSKVANFIGRVTGVGPIMNKIKEANKRRAERRAAAREVARQKQIEAARRKVEWIKDPERQQAAANLQTLIGARVRKADVADLFELDQSNSLAGNTRYVSGDYGELIYDDEPDGIVSIQAISPRFGQELALNNQMAAYALEAQTGAMAKAPSAQSPPSPSGAGDVRAKAAQWLKANKEEISVVAGNYVVPLAFGLARGDNYAALGGQRLYIGAGPEPQDPFEAWLFGPQTERAQRVNKYRKMGATTLKMRQDIQKVKHQKAVNTQQNRDLVERIKDPARKQAAIDLQTNRFIGKSASTQNLVGLMGDRRPRVVSDNTYEIESSLGRIYFDDLGDGSLSIQRVWPALGKELQLRNGLAAIVR